MNRIGVVRLLAATVLVSLGVAGLASCSGGVRPPPAEDQLTSDAGPPVTSSEAPSIAGFDPAAGLVFGDNGFVNCGTQAGAQTVTLKNPSSDVVNFTTNLTVGNDKYKVTPASGGVPAKGSLDVQIQPIPIPATSDVTPDLYAGTLAIKFATVDTPVNIRLHQTARGAIITHSFVGDAYDFGDVKVNTSSPKSFSLTNAGNLDVTANLQLGNPLFTIDGAATAAVALGGGKTASKSLAFEPVDLIPSTDTLAISFNSSAVHCGKPPNNVSLKGNGTSSVGVQPGTLNFGLVNCGGVAAGPQTITISTTIGLNFTPQLGQGSNSSFTLANDANGQTVTLGNSIPLAANASYVMRIVPKPVPIPSSVVLNALADTLTITTDAPNDKPHVVTINETAQGAILALTPTQIVQQGGVTAQLGVPFSLVNSGNASGGYSISTATTSAPNGGSMTSNLTSGTAGTGNTNGILTLTMPNSNGASYNGTLTVTAPGAVLCADLPPSMPVTGTANGNSITTVPSTLDFGFVACGTTATPQTITITSAVDADITPTLSAGAASPFTLANGATQLPQAVAFRVTANTPYILKVVPNMITAPSPTAIRQIYPAGVGDILTLTSQHPGTGTQVDPPKTIRVDQTAQGAVFTVGPSTISGDATVQLTNSGNTAISWSVTGTGGTANPSSGTVGTSPTNVSSISITKTGTGTLTFTPVGGSYCGTTGTVTIN